MIATRFADRRPWTAWVMVRVLALGLAGLAYALHRGNVFFDTNYYARWAHGALTGSRVPYRDFSWEYPPGALPVIALPGALERWLPGGFIARSIDGLYGALWVGFMLAIDAAVMRFVLHREAEVDGGPASRLWLYGPALLGAVCWTRYDLLPAAAALVTIVGAGAGLPRRSGAYAGVGAILKIWPAILAPIQRTRTAAVVAVASTVSIVAATAATTRLLTGSTGFDQVLHYQGRRGVQVESLPALPLLWLAHLRSPGYGTRYRFGAWEVVGGSASMLAAVVGAIGLAGIAIAIAAHWTFMRGGANSGAVALSSVAVMLVLLATDKVLSPQYFLWLFAVVVAACLLDPEPWRPFVPWVLAMAALTQVVFPWLYADVLRRAWPGLVALTVRDLLLLGLLAAAGRHVASAVKVSRRSTG